MKEFIFAVIIIALLASWLILFITKIKAREWVQVHGTRFIADLFGCDFCLSWWSCLLISIIFSIAMGDPVLCLCAFCAAPLTRYYIS